MKKILVVLAAAVFLTMAASSAYALHSFFQDTGLTYYDKEKAYPGYTLVRLQWGADKSATPQDTYLFDIEGNVVNVWNDAQGCRFIDNGNLFCFTTDGLGLQERDWSGKTVWLWKVPADRPDLTSLHHQNRGMVFNKKLNKYTRISIAMRTLKLADGLFLGADPAKMRTDATPDGVIEIDPDTNKIIWEWNSADHLIQNKYPDKANYVGAGKTLADYPGRYDINWGSGMRGDFVHFNSIDYNETLGQIVVNNSTGSEFWVLDHQGTFVPNDYAASKALAAGPKGDLLYRWGNPSLYGAGAEPSFTYGVASNGDQQQFFSHAIQWIKPGLKGAGNFLFLDNGARRVTGGLYTTIIEVNPYDSNGKYIPLMQAGLNSNRVSKQIVWSFKSKDYHSFYTHQGSYTHRLPNGNTFIATARGQYFQVTEAGEVVWEWLIPLSQDGIIKTRLFDEDGANGSFPTMYGADHPALKGKDLTPKAHLTTDREDKLNIFLHSW